MITIENISDYKNTDVFPVINIDWTDNLEVSLAWLFWGININFLK